MADVSVKMGVSGISQFKSEITQAQASVKTYDAALKVAEKQFRATGNAEQYMSDKTAALQGKLAAQQSAVRSAEAALKTMTENGVNQASTAYQKMQQSLLNAQAAVLDTQNDISNLGKESAEATGQTDKLAESLGGLNKKVSLDQVISAIGSITGAMEKAGKAAVDVGKQIWENITDSARWADDAATQAMILNMDVEDYQAYKKVFDTVGELTVQEWQKAKLKVQKAINDPSQDQTDILNLLGINTHQIMQGKTGAIKGAAKDFEEVFWEIGETLRAKVESGEMTQDLADTYANALFGRGFAELNPMFALGKEGFAKALEDQTVATKEAIEKNAAFNDALVDLIGDVESLKQEFTAGFTPALTGAAEAIDGMLTRLVEYLQTPEGQKALEDMGKAVESLFEDLGNIDPEKVVSNFAKLFGDVVKGFEWLSNNWSGVVTGIEAIAAAFGLLKVSEGVLTFMKMMQGFKGLGGGGEGNVGSEVTAASGGAPWFTTAMAGMTDKLAGLQLAAGNGVPVLDWLTNNTPVGRQMSNWLTGLFGGTPQFAEEDVIGDFKRNIENNASTFATDWTGVMGNIVAGIDKLFNGEDKPQVEVEPVAPENAAEDISKQVGDVTIPVTLLAQGLQMPGGGGGGGGYNVLMKKANGIPFVPFDGYPALLHKGERVVPARENTSRNFSSNLYIESMYMSSGMDADGLAAAIAARNQRVMAGFGS